MAIQYFWWILAVILIIAELLTGSLYLLAIAVGAVAGGVAALLGFDLWLQVMVSALGAFLISALVQRWRGKQVTLPSQENPDVLLDVGSPIYVAQWQPNHSARVQHRGAEWDARSRDTVAAPGWHKIVAIENNQIILLRDAQQPTN
jgi:membrane protein implicated in regulation of membrane protease activity